MRVTGGLLGGAWLAHLMADLGDGRFDGAWLAQKFEQLKPEKGIWEKYAHLLSHVDTERDRFLEFERWWHGFYTLSREEILEIGQYLFIGNQLENGEMLIGDHCLADLRKIKNPMIVFVSYGDNNTPSAQALGWIPVLRLVRQTAHLITETRKPLDPDDPMIMRKQAVIASLGDAIARGRLARDAHYERTFRTLYGTGTPLIQTDSQRSV